jgi:hypothetical protein
VLSESSRGFESRILRQKNFEETLQKCRLILF